MNEEAQRIAIAEACGAQWCDHSSRANEFCGHCGYGMMMFPYVDKITRRPLLDYLRDLNAMHEAEKVLTDEQCEIYFDYLNEQKPEIEDDYPAYHYVIHATAAQRAEAFRRTIGKWI